MTTYKLLNEHGCETHLSGTFKTFEDAAKLGEKYLDGEFLVLERDADGERVYNPEGEVIERRFA